MKWEKSIVVFEDIFPKDLQDAYQVNRLVRKEETTSKCYRHWSSSIADVPKGKKGDVALHVVDIVFVVVAALLCTPE